MVKYSVVFLDNKVIKGMSPVQYRAQYLIE